MPKERLAIVGASVRAAAQSALRAGFDVVGADLFADADLDGVCPITKIEDYPDGLADWLAEQDIDAWMYTGALENYPDLVDRMAKIAPLWGVSGEALRRCRDPLVLQEACHNAGIHFPETRTDADGLDRNAHWLGKTYRSASGAGVWDFEWGTATPTADRQGAVFQRHLEGTDWSAVYVVSPRESRLVSLTMQGHGDIWTGAKRYQYSMSNGPWCLFYDRIAEWLNRVGVFLRSDLDLLGIIGVDFIRVEDHDRRLEAAFLIEINPRYTASVEVGEAIAQKPFLSMHSAACRGESLEPVDQPYFRDHVAWQAARSYGKAIVFAKRPVTVSKRFAEWALKTDRPRSRLRIADIPRPGTRIQLHQPVVTVLVEGPFLAGHEAIAPAVSTVEQRLYA